MKRRLVLFALTVVLLLGVCATPVAAAREGDFLYFVEGGEAVLTHYTGNATVLAIPSTLGGYHVTKIEMYVFDQCNSLTSVIIPYTVTDISRVAFSNCTSLTTIDVDLANPKYSCDASGVLYNKNMTMLIRCPEGKQGTFDISNKVREIGVYAFSNCTGLTSVTIPTGVLKIGDCAFSDCADLTSMAIPDGVTEIGMYAFYRCTDLKSVTIPSSVANIASAAFWRCPALTAINVEEDNQKYSCDGNGVLFNKDKTTLIQYPCGKQGSYTISNIVTKIEAAAFANCAALTAINVAVNNPTYSSDDSGVLFNKDKTVLLQCPGGKQGSYTVPGTVTEIGWRAFEACSRLTSVTIPDGVTTIETGAFLSCDGLITVVIPKSVTFINNGAFAECAALTAIKVDVDNSNYSSDDSGVLFNKDKTVLLQCPGGKQGSFTIPDGVTQIGYHAFFGCVDLTSVTLPDSVTMIGSNAFEGCVGLILVTLPNSVTVIGSNAFEGCTGLNAVIIPESVTDIGYFVFNRDPQLTVYGDVGSFAETYAKENNIPFALYIKTTGVSLNKYSLALPVGGSEALTATVTPENAINLVNWKSDDTKVALVDSSGKVTAVSPGTANIAVTTADGGKTAVCVVTVPEPAVSVTGVSLNKDTFELPVGGSETLTATIEPENATNPMVNWNSDKPEIAEVDDNGKVAAVSPGTANITVTTADGGKTAVCVVTVTEPAVSVTGVSIKKSLDLFVGGSETLTAMIEPKNATNKAVNWDSDHTKVATVDSNGKITAVAPGTANITVTTADGGKTAVCVVTVTEPAVSVTGVNLNKESLNLFVGNGETLTAAVAPKNATNQTVSWSSDHTKVATVDSNGKVTAVAPGTANITVTTVDGDKTAACKVTVRNPVIAFGDIPANAWYKEYVDDLVSLGILNGKSEGKFDPQGKITRAEFAKILAYASGDDLTSFNKECVFADSRNHWSKQNINWAYEHEIVKGKGSGFAPNDNISRQEMAVMIARYANYKGINLTKKVETTVFVDDANIADWAKEAVYAMQQAAIISGKSGNLFDPEGNALRCEAAKMISVFLGL